MLDLQNELQESKLGKRTKQGTLSIHITSSIWGTYKINCVQHVAHE
jgi:hypothetical protein